MRKGHISLLLCDFTYITTFLCLQGEPSGFISKDSILGRLRRRVEVRGRPRHQEQGNTRRTGEARASDRCARPCTPGKITQAGQRTGTTKPCQATRPCCLARSGRVGWHFRAMVHGHASGGAPLVMLFRDFFVSGAFHSTLFLFFPLALGF